MASLFQVRPMNYSVLDRCGCILISGRMPRSKMEAIIECAPTGSVFADVELCYIAATDFILGPPERFHDLRLALAEEAIGRLREACPGAAALSADAQRWLAIGYQDSASASAFRHITGVAPPAFEQGVRLLDLEAVPFRQNSAWRFERLVSEVPEVRDGLDVLADLSPLWGRFVTRFMASSKIAA